MQEFRPDFSINLFSAYATQDWRYFHLSLAGIGLPCLLALWFLWESPRWLIQRRRFTEAKSVIGNIANMNKRPRPRLSESQSHTDDQSLSVIALTNNNSLAAVDETKEKESVILLSETVESIPSPTVVDDSLNMSSVFDTTPVKVTVWSPSTTISTDNSHAAKLSVTTLTKFSFTYFDVFRLRQFRTYLLVLVYSWFSSSLISVGIYFNIGALAGNRYLNALFLGLFKAFAGLIPLAVSPWVGRKPVLVISGLVVTVCCLAPIVAYFSWTEENGLFGTEFGKIVAAIAIIGASALDPVWKVNHIYSTELFPTVIRSRARASCNVGSRIASVIAPNISFLQAVYFPLPYAIFGVLSIGQVVLSAIFLPETKGMPLPELA